METFRVDPNRSLGRFLFVLLHQLFVQGQNILPFVVVNQVKLLHSGNNIIFLDGSLLADVVDGDGWRRLGVVVATGLDDLKQNVQNGVGPVTSIREKAQVTKRFFGASGFPFKFGQLVTELDQELAITLSLVRWEGENAGDIVIFRRFLFLGEVADDVKAPLVKLAHNVKKEGVSVVIQGFVI